VHACVHAYDTHISTTTIRGVQDSITETRAQSHRQQRQPWDKRPREMEDWEANQGEGRHFTRQARTREASRNAASGPIGEAQPRMPDRHIEKAKGKRPFEDDETTN
jgi:hypothetical protein